MARATFHSGAGVDLHVHTSVSDGSVDPAPLIEMAAAAGLSIIAVTDHDTVAGLKEAKEHGNRCGVTVVRGIELSADYLGHSIHILGLGIGEPDSRFDDMLREVLDGRRKRNPQIIRKLNELGYTITLEDAKQTARGEIVSRPHIAQVMVERGYVANSDEAFHRFLNRGRPAYQERYRPSVSEATDIIHHLGGIAVPAHPGLMRFDHRPDDLLYHFTQFRKMGIDGIETHYPTHSAAFMNTLSGIADSLSLLESGGSDFHGTVKPNKLGYGTEHRPIICADLSPILERLGFTITESALSVPAW